MHASYQGSEYRAGLIRVEAEADEIVAVCLEGDFDLANAGTLSEEADRVLEDGYSLIFDLSQATFIDSTVVHVLIRAAKAVNGSGRVVVLQLGTAAVVERILELVGIERVLPRAHDRQDAVTIIQQRLASVSRAARNQSMFRAVNEKISAVNEAFATMTETFAIACECYDASCIETIHIRSEDYFQVRADPRQFVVSPGHVLPEVETVVHETHWWVVVEKTGTAGEVAELLDPSDTPAEGRTA